jgi:hypothetical protein
VSTCQCVISKLLAPDHAPAEEQVQFLVCDREIIELFKPHELSLVQALGNQEQTGAIKADGL